MHHSQKNKYTYTINKQNTDSIVNYLTKKSSIVYNAQFPVKFSLTVAFSKNLNQTRFFVTQLNFVLVMFLNSNYIYIEFYNDIATSDIIQNY